MVESYYPVKYLPGGKSTFSDGGNLIKTRATGWSAHFKCIRKDTV